MSQHFLQSAAAKTLSLAQVFRMSDADAETMFRKRPLAGNGRRAGLPALRRLERLRMPPPEWLAPLPLPRLREGFHASRRDAVRLAQAPAARLSRRYRDLLQ